MDRKPIVVREFSSKELEMVENFAQNAMLPIHFSKMLEISLQTFLQELRNKDSLLYKHYEKGRIMLIYEINKALINTAKMGSPQAISTLKKIK